MQILKNKGFTLIELLVVIGIIVFLAGAVLPQLDNFNRSQSLQRVASEIQSNLIRAQNNATAGLRCNPTNSAKSWFLLINNPPTSYTVEAVCNGTGTPTSNTYTLPSGITFSSVLMNSPCSTDNINGDLPKITFDSVSGNVSYSNTNLGCQPNSQTTKMTITLTSDSGTATLVVEKGGSISLTTP